MSSLMTYLLVGVGGFAGANARLLVGRWVGALVETRLPLATFLINISGSFLLGVLGVVIAQRAVVNADAVRLALGVGFLGAFTTFSTFEYETHALLEDGSWFGASVYVCASVFIGLVAVRVGIVAGRMWLR